MMDWERYFKERADFDYLGEEPILGINIEELYQAFKARLMSEVEAQVAPICVTTNSSLYKQSGELKDKAAKSAGDS